MIVSALRTALIVSTCFVINTVHAFGGVVAHASKSAATGLMSQLLGNPQEGLEQFRTRCFNVLKANPEVLRQLIKDELPESPGKNSATIDQYIEFIQTHPQATYTTSPVSAAQTVSTLATALQAIPGAADRPVFINLNVHDQVAENTVQVSTPIISAPEPARLPEQRGIWAWIKNHKLLVGAGCLAAGYAALHYYLWRLASYLNKPTCWSLWKKQCSLEELYRIKQDELVESIASSLESSSSSNQPAGQVIQFVQEAEKELSYLQRYQTIARFLETWCLSALFFYDKKIVEQAQDRIQRLQFLKNTVLGWLSNFKGVQSYSILFNNA